MRRSGIYALVAILTLVLASPAAAGDLNWKVYTYNPSGNALSSHQADDGTGGPAFTFTTTTDTALFAAQRLEGPNTSLAGRTITATFRIDAAAATTFEYYGQTSSNGCGTPASVRLYFSSNGSFGSKKDWYSNFWWSNSAGSSEVLATGPIFTLTAKVAAENWSNWNGQQGTTQGEGFAAAAADPALIGFSFGGGCGYENGVGARPGPATFTMLSFVIGK